jgi:hypothetical protein
VDIRVGNGKKKNNNNNNNNNNDKRRDVKIDTLCSMGFGIDRQTLTAMLDSANGDIGAVVNGILERRFVLR